MTDASDKSKPRKPPETPVILHYNDTMTSRLHHLEPANGLDPEKAELRMLELFPRSRLKELPILDGCDVIEREARANELRHFCNSYLDSGGFLERALKQFAFEGMLLKVADENGDIVDLKEVDDCFKFHSNLWDHPYSKLSEFQELRFPGDNTEKAFLTDTSPLSSFRNLDDWCFVEHFDNKTMIQVSIRNDSFLVYSQYCDITYFSFNDFIYLYLFQLYLRSASKLVKKLCSYVKRGKSMPHFPAKKWWCQGGQVTTNKPTLIAGWVYSRRLVCGVCRLYLPDKKKPLL